MKVAGFAAFALAICISFTGCGFSSAISDLDILDFSNKRDEESLADTEYGELESAEKVNGDVNIEKADSQKSDGDRVTSAGQAYGTVTEVYYAVADSVVEITTETVQMSMWGQYVSSGAGSGVIIEEKGFIVTNYHVIEGANSVAVRLTDGSEYSASLVGYDEVGDLAVIKINASNKKLTAAKLGCSADLEVGESVIALGNPLGSLGGTLTTGIISAKERNITVNGEQMVLLQTNAAINPGNSGGGLFNMAGQLIGIVNAKVSEEGIEGLGFAIPIDIAYKSIVDLVKYGYVRGVVDSGLTVLDVTNQNLPSAYKKYGITTTGVIIIESKYSDDLKCGDKIVAVGDVMISSSAEFDIALKHYSVGDDVTFSVTRGGKNVTVDIILREKVSGSVNFE